MKSFLDSKVFKALFVSFMVILLLIPLLFVGNLVEERKNRKQVTQTEISNQWSLSQRINGPYIKVPVDYISISPTNKSEIYKSVVFFSPSDLAITGTVSPIKRKRGIYEVILYDADLQLAGNFEDFEWNEKNISKVDWEQAEIYFGISDMRGLNEKIFIETEENRIELKNSDEAGFLKAKMEGISNLKKDLKFSFKLKFRGSESLNFHPSSSNTSIALSSTWNSPSFYGSFLPIKHDISKDGFTAKWNVLELNRNIPKIIKSIDSNENSKDTYNFGVKFLEPNDNYQKNERAVKYGVLIIALTFLCFFFSELWFNRKVNFIQYGLIGFALVIFYCLLLSFSEIISFNPAYLTSSLMTIVLLFFFSKSLFESAKPAFFVVSTIGVLYTFIFVIIQLEDTALLIGSLGLFLIIAVTMWASRKVKWE